MRTNKGIITSVQAHKIMAQKINEALATASKSKTTYVIDAVNMRASEPAKIIKLPSK